MGISFKDIVSSGGSGGESFNKLKRVESPSDLAGTLDSTVSYLIDGIIDMGTQSIEVPSGGLSLIGYTFDTSKLRSSESNYTMFTSPSGGSGNVLGADYAIEVTGSNSKVYDLKSATGFDAFEFYKVNYNNCSSLGEIDNYRQGLEVGTGRFGGSPSLTLTGEWLGGFFFDTSIVRNLDAGMTEPLFKAGVGFTMTSRFRTNLNADLPTSAALLDFSNSNFTNPSTLQLSGAIITRNGVSNPEDTNITPNISNEDLASSFTKCEGITNTFVGGKLDITSEATTVINSTNTFENLAGVFTQSDFQHCDEPSNGQIRNLGNNPRDFDIYVDAIVDGPSNNQLTLKVVKWDDSASTFVDIVSQRRQVNSLLGARDVAFFNILTSAKLDINDYVFLQIANNSDSSDLTAETDSYLAVSEK